MMRDVRTASSTQTLDHVGWRYAVLRDAGVGRRAARSIAAQSDVDVHELVSLLERGCDLCRALRIIAPADGAA